VSEVWSPNGVRVRNNSRLSFRQAGNRFFALFTLLFGLLFTGLGIGLSGMWRANWPAIEATVTDLRSCGNRGSMAPTFSFMIDGQHREYTSSICSYPHPHIGDIREMRVNPTDSNVVGQYRPGFLWFLTGIPFGLGIGLIGRSAFNRAHAVQNSPEYRDAYAAQLEAELHYFRGDQPWQQNPNEDYGQGWQQPDSRY